MNFGDYRVMKRPEPGFQGSWGLWSDKERQWIDIVFPTEREAYDMLRHMREQDQATSKRDRDAW